MSYLSAHRATCGQWQRMKFEDLFSPETIEELRQMERNVIRQEQDACQAQTELTARFLATRRVPVSHIILDPSENNVIVEFSDESILLLGSLPPGEWGEIVRCALYVARQFVVSLDCVDAKSGDCFVQFDRSGALVPFHPKSAHFATTA